MDTEPTALITTDPPSDGRPSRRLSALLGVLVAGVALGVAELVAGLRSGWRSPVLDVGDRVIDRVPRPVKELAIDWFGTNDKRALLVGIAVLLTLAAAVIGVLGFRRRSPVPGLIGVAAFGVVGSWAAAAARTDRPWTVVVPSLVGTAAGMVALLWLRGRWGERERGATGEHVDVAVDLDRRRFLAGAATLAGVAVLAAAGGRALASRAEAVARRAAAVVLPRARRPLAPLGAGVQAPVEGVSPFVTPNADFYRIDVNLSFPSIDPDSWRLRVHGMVEHELQLTYGDLLDRELVEADITMACVSNEVGGSLIGNARWRGARLDELLDEAGIDPAADQIVGRSVDGFTAGFPVAALDGRDALVAVGMNGVALPRRHGFPARLVVPGLYGYVSATKWLGEIEVTRFDRSSTYWVDRGWSREAPIKLSSRIDTPRGLASLTAGRVAVAGVAWAPQTGVAQVQVRVDDGPWLDATLADEASIDSWRQWWLPWDATSGQHRLTVRAVARSGAMQVEDRATPFPDGATGLHSILVVVG